MMMDWAALIPLALALGMDVLSVCMAVGVRWHGRGQRIRMACGMGGGQFVMPLIGYLVGRQLAGLLSQWGKLIAAVLLAGIGLKMLIEVIRNHPGEAAEDIDKVVEHALHIPPKADPTRGWSLVILSIATSLDALVVGFSLGVNRSGIWVTSAIIGVVSAVMAVMGIAIGKRLGKRLGRYAELLGALVLLVLAVKFLIA
jgi:putative Mn2+ efflux pump MntP